MSGILCGLTLKTQTVYDILNSRDQDGMSILDHSIYTAQYRVLEVKPISNAIAMLWSSSVTPNSAFF